MVSLPVTLPNTFVVGCAKAGTSAICAYLGDHEQAFVPAMKEPDWFARDLGLAEARGIADAAAYRALFEPAGAHHLVRVDGSPSSLLSAVAASEISAEVPEARIVILLRSPVEVIHSLHFQTVVAGLQPTADFDAAVREALGPPTRAHDPFSIWTRYFDVVRLAEQTARYLEQFPRDQLHLIRFESLRDEPRAVWADLQGFLGLRHQDLPRGVVNANSEARIPRLQRLAYHPRSPLRRVGRRVMPRSARGRISRALYRMNVRERPRPPMAAETRALILHELSGEVRRLEELLGWDLSSWVDAEQDGAGQARR